jgi:4'-phosphopantetheinyl transferase
LGTIINLYLIDVLWQDDARQELVINNNEVHVWRININQNIKRLGQFEALLTAEETLRAGKYRQQKDTYRFIVSRGAQRIILGRYLAMPPDKLEFVLGDNKKPYLVSGNGELLQYNLSHSGDWIVLAIAQLPVGADVEFVDPLFSFQDIVQDNFSREESDYISTSPKRFFTLWTRKEAILKATGQGLGDHLRITPALDGEHILGISLTGADKDWLLNSFDIAPGYISTVVCEGANQQLKFFDVDLT